MLLLEYEFDNGCSHSSFLGEFPSVEAVQEFDNNMLAEVHGSYEEIADQMREYIEFSEELRQANVFEPRHYAGAIEVRAYPLTVGALGAQECPFGGCEYRWHDCTEIKNVKTGRTLLVNCGTEHLAREHHFLEKGNAYGVTAKEFYNHFM